MDSYLAPTRRLRQTGGIHVFARLRTTPTRDTHDDHLRGSAALGENDILDSPPVAQAFANTQKLDIDAGSLGEALEPGHNTGSFPR